jgi:hypothetical protein
MFELVNSLELTKVALGFEGPQIFEQSHFNVNAVDQVLQSIDGLTYGAEAERLIQKLTKETD